MISTSHVIIGGTIGVAVGAVTHSPAAALIAGIASHFLMDSIPHLDHPPIPYHGDEPVYTPALWIFIAIDSIVAATFTLSMWYLHFGFPQISAFFLGAFGGVLPDLIDNVPFWNKFTRSLPGMNYFHRWHELTHIWWRRYLPMPKEVVLPNWWLFGIATQVVAISVAIAFLSRQY